MKEPGSVRKKSIKFDFIFESRKKLRGTLREKVVAFSDLRSIIETKHSRHSWNE